MQISESSQLGLRFKQEDVKVDFLQLMKDYLEKELGLTESVINKLCDVANAHLSEGDTLGTYEFSEDEYEYVMDGKDDLPQLQNIQRTRNKITDLCGLDVNLIDDNDSSYYFICDSVYKTSELIRIKDGFTGRTLKDINFGKYTYLMGKDRMVRFVVVYGAIKGVYYDSKKRIVFEWGIEMETGDYYFSHGRSNEFTELMRILTFIEFGDIEVKMLAAGKNNGLPKKDGKITNGSNNTVYVVDSTWNLIVIRTDGFAVRGHFRLQPFGHNMADRKLIWIDAFEKHGYTRRPRAEIVR